MRIGDGEPLVKRIAGLYIAWLVAAVLLVFAATGRHPYNFYTALRWICCAVFVYSAFTAREKNRVAWTWIFGALAVLSLRGRKQIAPIFHLTTDQKVSGSNPLGRAYRRLDQIAYGNTKARKCS